MGRSCRRHIPRLRRGKVHHRCPSPRRWRLECAGWIKNRDENKMTSFDETSTPTFLDHPHVFSIDTQIPHSQRLDIFSPEVQTSGTWTEGRLRGTATRHCQRPKYTRGSVATASYRFYWSAWLSVPQVAARALKYRLQQPASDLPGSLGLRMEGTPTKRPEPNRRAA